MHEYVIANAWYCTHLWQHYRYTLAKRFLERAFPAMLSATQYWLDRMVLDPKDGTYVCPKEYSPEHGPVEDGMPHAQQLVWELFDNTLKAVDILSAKRCGIDAKELLANRRGKGTGGLVGGQIVKRKAVGSLLGAKKAFDAEGALLAGKLQASAVCATLPGGVFFAFVFIQGALGGGGETVKHGLDKDGKRAFSPAVFLVQDV